MAFCSSCGKELMDGARFCTGCGSQSGPAAAVAIPQVAVPGWLKDAGGDQEMRVLLAGLAAVLAAAMMIGLLGSANPPSSGQRVELFKAIESGQLEQFN